MALAGHKLDEQKMWKRAGEVVSGCLHFETVLRIFVCCLWYGRRVGCAEWRPLRWMPRCMVFERVALAPLVVSVMAGRLRHWVDREKVAGRAWQHLREEGLSLHTDCAVWPASSLAPQHYSSEPCSACSEVHRAHKRRRSGLHSKPSACHRSCTPAVLATIKPLVVA